MSEDPLHPNEVLFVQSTGDKGLISVAYEDHYRELYEEKERLRHVQFDTEQANLLPSIYGHRQGGEEMSKVKEVWTVRHDGGDIVLCRLGAAEARFNPEQALSLVAEVLEASNEADVWRTNQDNGNRKGESNE